MIARPLARAAAGVLLAAAVLGVSACSSSTTPGSPSAAPAAAGSPTPAAAAPTSAGPTEQSVLDLEVGQCINPPGGQDQADLISSVTVVDCAEPHLGEIFSLPQLPDGAFPGTDAVQGSAEELCTNQDFETYVGVPYQESEIFSSPLVPTEETWAQGDREVACLLVNEEGTETTGSLRGANR